MLPQKAICQHSLARLYEKMLGRVWRNWNARPPLVGRNSDRATTIDNTMVVSQKVKNKITT